VLEVVLSVLELVDDECVVLLELDWRLELAVATET